MILSINIAGHSGHWRFLGSDQLETLLSPGVWNSGGGCFVLRTNRDNRRRIAERLQREIVAVSTDRECLRVLLFEDVDRNRGLFVTLEQHRRPGTEVLGVSFEGKEEVVNWLTREKTILIACPSGDPHGTLVSDDTRELLDWTSKMSPHRTLTVFLVQDTGSEHGMSGLDMTRGRLVDELLPVYRLGDEALWRAYVHLRLTWEAASELSLAEKWGQESVTQVKPLDDDNFELFLNQKAVAELSEVPTKSLAAVKQYITEYVKPNRSRSRLLSLQEQLKESSLLWTVNGSGWAQPVPWLSRALLLNSLLPATHPFLRGTIICLYLSRELISRCLDLESRERGVCWAHRTNENPEKETAERFESYQRGNGSLTAMLYPKHCPAVPRDAWPFATFGEFLSATKPTSELVSIWHELRKMRNELVHGHCIGWKALRRLIDIEIQLEP